MNDRDSRRGEWLMSDGRRMGAPRKRLGTRHSHIEELEPRWCPSAVPVTFNIPADVAARGVYVSVSATLEANYTNNQGITLNSGTVVYYDSSINDYAAVTSSSSLTYELSGTGAVVELPNTFVTGGQIVIGVGSAPPVSYASGAVQAPPATNDPNYWGLFEYAITSGGLDIDMSEVDQVGFPFTITTTPAAPMPADEGVGITQNRTDLFNLYNQYIAGQGATAALFEESISAGQPYRILAPQHLIEGTQAPVAGAPTYSAGGSLVTGDTYYYWVTATDASGETSVSNVTLAVPFNDSQNGHNIAMDTVNLSWSASPGATGYNIYRSLTNDSTTGQLVGSSTTTSFTDPGNTPTSQTPPANSYTYNPLNAYFNQALTNFFGHYTANGSFTINRDGYTFTGQVDTNYQTEGHTYTVLELTSTSLPGQTFLIFEPFFSTNTNIAGAPPAPSWMPHADQSPAAMIMANDGVFNDGGSQPGADAGILSDLENSIVSAFNRGIADNFSIAPNNWAAEPSLNSATATAGSGLSPGTYYYVITATNIFGETTTSIERAATTTSTDGQVTLSWTAENGPNQGNSDGPTQYNIYRSTTPGSGYQLVGTITNNGVNPATSYTDSAASGTSQTPPTYYAPGSTSNWYAGFLHQNSTTNPTSGISINSLAYGFPYDDQGGDSTNFQANFSAVQINLMPWGTNPDPHHGPGPDDHWPGIKVLQQPSSGVLGASNSITFEVLNAEGVPVGGVPVTVEFAEVEGHTFTVVTDPTTGIGRFTFKNFEAGPNMIVLETDSQLMFQFSNVFIVFAGFVPTDGANIILPNGQQANVSSLGQNALPATDLPSTWTNGMWANAVPWNSVDGMVNSLAGVTRIDSLETGPLGLFQQLGRGGHGVLPPEELPPKSENIEDETTQITLDLDEILDTIARARNAEQSSAKTPNAGGPQGTRAKSFR